MLYRLGILLFLLVGMGFSAAQSLPVPQSVPPYLAQPLFQMNVRSGPGQTYGSAGILREGQNATLVERNHTGNWVHIFVFGSNGEKLVDGWVVSGFLALDPALRFSQLPINSSLADALPENAEGQSLKPLYAAPVMPSISAKMRDVYQLGQALGNRPNTLSKVGDSVLFNTLYLNPMARGDHQLGPYDYLDASVRFFGASAALPSVAAGVGEATYTLLDIDEAAQNPSCKPGENLLVCEYRLKRPAIAMIMFSGNDVKHSDGAKFKERMREIIETSLLMGVIPVLSTFSANPNSDTWWNSVALNTALVELAAEYQVPLINLWVAARLLPEYGLEQDDIHMKNSGFEYINFKGGTEAFYGVALQNLLGIRMLDELRLFLQMDALPPTPAPTPTLAG